MLKDNSSAARVSETEKEASKHAFRPLELPAPAPSHTELFFWPEGTGVLFAKRAPNNKMAMAFFPAADEVTLAEFVRDIWPAYDKGLNDSIGPVDIPARPPVAPKKPAQQQQGDNDVVDPETLKQKEGETRTDFLKRKNKMRTKWKEKQEGQKK